MRELLLNLPLHQSFPKSLGLQRGSLRCFTSMDAGKIEKGEGDVDTDSVVSHGRSQTIGSAQTLPVCLCSSTAPVTRRFKVELRYPASIGGAKLRRRL